ncbi:MAG: hypothetical protein ACOVMM_11090 [Chitinophagaceae bacterium]
MEENFSHIQLPNFVIADWFKHHLIDEKVEKTTSKPNNNEQTISFFGNNKKNIVILVHETDGVFISDSSLSLLEKLLIACKLTLDDVAIINLSKNNVNYKDLKQQLQPQTLIFMGIEPSNIKLPFIFPFHKIQAYDNCKMLITTSIESMQQTQNPKVLQEKKELWMLLKQLFGL